MIDLLKKVENYSEKIERFGLRDSEVSKKDYNFCGEFLAIIFSFFALIICTFLILPSLILMAIPTLYLQRRLEQERLIVNINSFG